MITLIKDENGKVSVDKTIQSKLTKEIDKIKKLHGALEGKDGTIELDKMGTCLASASIDRRLIGNWRLIQEFKKAKHSSYKPGFGLPEIILHNCGEIDVGGNGQILNGGEIEIDGQMKPLRFGVRNPMDMGGMYNGGIASIMRNHLSILKYYTADSREDVERQTAAIETICEELWATPYTTCFKTSENKENALMKNSKAEEVSEAEWEIIKERLYRERRMSGMAEWPKLGFFERRLINFCGERGELLKQYFSRGVQLREIDDLLKREEPLYKADVIELTQRRKKLTSDIVDLEGRLFLLGDNNIESGRLDILQRIIDLCNLPGCKIYLIQSRGKFRDVNNETRREITPASYLRQETILNKDALIEIPRYEIKRRLEGLWRKKAEEHEKVVYEREQGRANHDSFTISLGEMSYAADLLKLLDKMNQ